MWVSIFSMWVFRMFTSVILGVWLQFAAVGVWIAMIMDWIFRAVMFTWRFHSGRWKLQKPLIHTKQQLERGDI